jgi:glutamate--cysteine ligase
VLTSLIDRLQELGPERLRGIRRGVEKEGLRTNAQGQLVHTPHPARLGSALTHPHVTTDFSESQLELVTGVHASAEACVEELVAVHQVVQHTLHEDLGELMWSGSMPCELPADQDIPIGQYGSSNVGQAKTVYRHGLSHRYGPRMQTISGIHYNWSIPGLGSDDYFSLIRNFRRHSFLLLMLFGASPAVPASFVAGLPHELDSREAHTCFLPHATSLRMGRLGYQSDAQSALCVSYNSLEGYARSLQGALTRPYPAYEAIGIQDAAGRYKQLSTSLLQIENEFYSTIRPKRVIFPGERPLHALRERGVEYVEVRCMDLNPFLPVGIDAHTMRVIDVFLMHCLLADSPPDSPVEIAELARNQQRTASRGREPGLMLERAGRMVALQEWGREILQACEPIAQAMDAAEGGRAFAEALAQAQAQFESPETLPSARVLQAMAADHGGSHTAFALACSQQAQADLLAMPQDPARLAQLCAMAEASVVEQARIEASDSLLFEAYRQAYLSPERLGIDLP